MTGPETMARDAPVHPLSAAVLLDVWERGQGAPPARQATLLLDAACPDVAPGALAALTPGARDARLLRLRARTFGDRLEGVLACPACGETLELALSAAELLEGRGSGDAEAAGGASGAANGRNGGGAGEDAPGVRSVTRDGWSVRFRLPTAADLVAVAGEGGAAGPERLLARCVVEARRGDEPVDPALDVLPGTVVAAVVEGMEAADPDARTLLDATCPACGHRWRSPFDVVSYFWTEIDGWARGALRDVHDLARAYGWSEAHILAMSAWRRRAYLELVRR